MRAAGVAAVSSAFLALVPAGAARAATTPAATAPATTAPAARAGRTRPPVLPEIDLDHVVVRFGSRTAGLSARLAFAGARLSRAVAGTSWTELSTPGHGARRVRAALLHDPAVAQVELSYFRHALTVPDDPLWASKQSSYLSPLRLDRAWDAGRGSGVTVAVVDTGVELDHPDLAGRLTGGYDVLNPGAPPLDDNGHGTMVAGIIAARTDNGVGVVGVAPDARVMPVKVLDSTGRGSDADIAVGIDWARTHHARVVNLSLGGVADDPMLADAVHNAVAAGIVVVAAAGNDAAPTVGFPAGYPGVVAVGATGHDGALAAFSSYGLRIDVVAPGLDITSTGLGSSPTYATGSGTSFSSPIVAGVAALIRGKYPTFTPAQVVDRIHSSARDVGLPGVDPAFGYGIVDPLAALGGAPAAPRPSGRVGADEPNDVPSHATSLSVGVSHAAQLAPETDEDWYRVHLVAGIWYSIHVPASGPALDHELDPIVELYQPDKSFAASQALAGGDVLARAPATGDYLVRVRNNNGSTAPYTIVVRSIAPPPRFGPSLDFNLDTSAQSVGIADVDGDGRADALIAFGDASGFPDTLAVLKQTSDRSLAFYAVLPTDTMVGGGMATGDLDGDTHADVAIPVNGGFDIFTNVSPSTVPVAYPGPGTVTPKQLTIADVDGDTHNDIVAVGPFGARVYWGPTFLTSTAVTATAAGRVAAADVTMHADALLDVVTCCANAKVNVYRQTSARVFAAAAAHTAANAATLAVGDVNSDTNPDVVTGNTASDTVSRLLQNGSGGLLTPVATPAAGTVASHPDPVAVADVDADTKNDIVVLHDSVSSQPALLGWLRQNSTDFDAEQTFRVDDFGTTYDPRALAVGDLEGDGRDDALVATGFGIAMLVQNSGHLPALGKAWVTDVQPSSMAVDVSAAFAPTVTLGRAVTNVSPATVHLFDGHGNAIAAAVAYDGGTKRITITPSAALANGRYAVHLGGLTDGVETLADYGTTFTVGPAPDETAPQTTLHAPPSGTRTVAGASLSFTSSEAGSTFECSLDNGPYRTCSSPRGVTTTAGRHTFRVFARDPAGNEDSSAAVATWVYAPPVPPVHGYWMLGAGGAIYPFGTVPHLGGAATSSAVDVDATPSGRGYWVVDATGRVFAFGDAHAHGGSPALAAGDVITSISRTATGNGYWLFSALGGVYPFGDARSYGDMRAAHLNGPVLDSVGTPSGHGYYMVASDGGVFSFGDARFHGSTGSLRLAAPVRSLVPDPDGAGYWLVATDGGVFAFDAPFRGSMGSARLNRPIVGMVSFGDGYLMVASDGGIFDFSTKPFFGSLGGNPPAIPIVSVAATG